MRPSSASDRRELLTELVLRAVELVPAGEVASYGDIAAIVGTGPRQVGTVMARDGAGVPWWRITNASGQLPAHLLDEAREHWQHEGIETTPSGCRITRHRTDMTRLAELFRHAAHDLVD